MASSRLLAESKTLGELVQDGCDDSSAIALKGLMACLARALNCHAAEAMQPAARAFEAAGFRAHLSPNVR